LRRPLHALLEQTFMVATGWLEQILPLWVGGTYTGSRLPPFFSWQCHPAQFAMPPIAAVAKHVHIFLSLQVTRALKARDLDTATAAKTANEDLQRQGVRERAERHEEWKQRHFHLDPATGLWVYNGFKSVPAV